MKLKRERVLLIAMFVLASLLIPGNYGQTEGMTRSFIQSAQGRDEALWAFWHITSGKHLASEEYPTEEECKGAENTWSKHSGVGPIAFRCSEVTNKLLAEANARCERKEDYACEWKESIQALLKRQTVP